MTLKKQLYSPEEMTAAISMIAAAIRRDFDTDGSVPYALVGLYNQGVPLAERICDEIERATGRRPEHGRLDISMYRDDVGLRSGLPLIRETVIPFNIDGHKIILVDDVLSSGRTIRAALESVPAGQMEAGYCVGMTYLQTMRRIVLPQALRTAFPPLFNSLISLLKDTSLAANITVTEMFMATQRIVARTYESLPLYLEVAFIYLMFSTILTQVQRWGEKKLNAKGFSQNS